MRILETGVLVLEVLDLLDEVVVSFHLLVQPRSQLYIFIAEGALLLAAVEIFLTRPFELTRCHKVPGVMSAVVLVGSPVASLIIILAGVVAR